MGKKGVGKLRDRELAGLWEQGRSERFKVYDRTAVAVRYPTE